MVSHFEDYFSVEVLNADYERLLAEKYDFIEGRSYLPPGADRKDKDEFEKQRDQHLRAISRKVLQGRWEFSPFLESSVPKTGGGERIISLATIRDTLVQRALYRYLYPTIDPLLSDSAVAYRKGKGAHLAVRKIRAAFSEGYEFILDADIEKFFDTVDHETLVGFLSTVTMDTRASDLIRRFIKAPRVTPEDKEFAENSKPKMKYPRTQRNLGLPQGGILSGMLANYYLCHLDRHIEATKNILVRYADDFVVCCPNISEVGNARDVADQALKDLSLRLHPKKTTSRLASEGIDFVGFRIYNDSVKVKPENIARFKARIRKVVDSHRVFRSDPDLDIERLIGRVKYKIEGPAEELKANSEIANPYQRSWIGYYRIVDDYAQIRRLDNWVRKQLSKYSWQVHGRKLTAKKMQQSGLPSLYATYWRSRRSG